jgi:DNA-binding XRE family transcriptional regulator
MATAPANAPRTGLDLRLRRTERLITQTAIARELGISRQAVTALEALMRPNPRAVERYLAALERIAGE